MRQNKFRLITKPLLLSFIGLILTFGVSADTQNQTEEGGEILIMEDDERVNYWHADHWHGPLELKVGSDKEFKLQIEDSGGFLRETQNLEWKVLEQGAEKLDLDSQESEVQINPEEVGETSIVFEVYEKNKAWETEPLKLNIESNNTSSVESSSNSVGKLVVKNKRGEELNQWHKDHWHGRLEIERGQTIFDLEYINHNDNKMEIGEEVHVNASVLGSETFNAEIVDAELYVEPKNLSDLEIIDDEVVFFIEREDGFNYITQSLDIYNRLQAVEQVNIYDRSFDQPRHTATWNNGWEGELPTVEESGHISIGADFEHEAIEIGENKDFQMGIEVVDGGSLYVESNQDFNGDYVDIHGRSSGQDTIKIQLLDEWDNVYWSSEEITVNVESTKEEENLIRRFFEMIAKP